MAPRRLDPLSAVEPGNSSYRRAIEYNMNGETSTEASLREIRRRKFTTLDNAKPVQALVSFWFRTGSSTFGLMTGEGASSTEGM
jgi:hypothetical protein